MASGLKTIDKNSVKEMAYEVVSSGLVKDSEGALVLFYI